MCQQKAQWGSSNLTRGLDQSSMTKGNKKQWGKTYLLKNKTNFWFIQLLNASPGAGSLESLPGLR